MIETLLIGFHNDSWQLLGIKMVSTVVAYDINYKSISYQSIWQSLTQRI